MQEVLCKYVFYVKVTLVIGRNLQQLSPLLKSIMKWRTQT